MSPAERAALVVAVAAVTFAVMGLGMAWRYAPPGAPSMRQSARITLRIVTGRGRRSVPISAPRPVALSLGSTRPVFIDPHILRPIEEGTPLISLAFERRARGHLRAVHGSEAA
jgi:hypothetical protein